MRQKEADICGAGWRNQNDAMGFIYTPVIAASLAKVTKRLKFLAILPYHPASFYGAVFLSCLIDAMFYGAKIFSSPRRCLVEKQVGILSPAGEPL